MKKNALATKILSLLLVLMLAVGMLASCMDNNDPPHGECEHVDVNPKDGKCDKCGQKMSSSGKHTHVDADGDGKCDKCGKKMSEVENDPEFPWDTTTLLYQLTDNSNGKELPSGCRRYMSGELADGDKPDGVDSQVLARNDAAAKFANVKVVYDYLPDTAGYGWGANIERITTETHSNANDLPDIYCNFVYDMIGASLKASFANLKTQSRQSQDNNGKNTDIKGANHFDFMNEKYGSDVLTRYNQYSEQVGDRGGYMLEYMNSLTLSQTKMYLLASDYYIDLIRAFFIVPVNIAMFEEISGVDPSVHKDRNGDGKTDIVDFSIMVIDDKEWTYDTVIAYASVYKPQGAQTSINDEKIGFAVTRGSMQAAGLLYTTSITIIHKVKQEVGYDYDYFYPGSTGHENDGNMEDLYTFTDNLTNLFRKTGICASNTSNVELVRNKFANNQILFGDVMCLGSLAYEQYQAMKGEDGSGGFAIAPVPLYRDIVDANGSHKGNDNYLTQIHNIGRVGAISVATKKFAQCSAYLNYQSTHSTDILNYYYDNTLKYDVASGSEEDIKMLDYIRYNVRSSFDKAYEDAIALFAKTQDKLAVSNKWHEKITAATFQYTTLRQDYNTLMKQKQGYLNQMYDTCYPNLPE